MDARGGRGRTFDRTLAEVRTLLDWLEEAARDLSIPLEWMRPVELAVEEVFANCVRHNPEGKGPIEVRFDLDGRRIRVAIVDPDTDGYDLRAAADARTDLPLERRKPGGLGIHFVRAIVDELDYRHEGRRAVTVLVKNLG